MALINERLQREIDLIRTTNNIIHEIDSELKSLDTFSFKKQKNKLVKILKYKIVFYWQ